GAHRALHSFPTRRSSDLSPEGNSVIEMRREAAQGRAEFAWGLPANQLWTAETPFLWRFEARVEAEDGSINAESVRYGIRTIAARSEEHTSELQSRFDLVC